MSFAICRVYPVIVALYLVMSLSGCVTTTTAKLTPEVPAMHSVSEFSDDEQVGNIADPWEGFNRSMYKFNYHFDRYFFLPVVSGYEFITPIFIQKGVSNFFGNIGEFHTLYNSLFQLKGKKSLITFGRFVTNSTIGIVGLFDPATRFGLEAQSEDFGRTLGYWGVDSGPYLLVPVLGPNTLRSTGGFAVDAGIRFAAISAIDPLKMLRTETLFWEEYQFWRPSICGTGKISVIMRAAIPLNTTWSVFFTRRRSSFCS
jgi:phospholipid-binding lipoprotein MlaA